MKFKILILLIFMAVFSLISFSGCSNMLEEVLKSTAVGSFTINDDSYYTFSESVVLNNDVTDAESMRFRNDDSSWSDWEDYAGTKSWTLAVGHSSKIVYGEFRHPNGNIIQSSDEVTPIIEEKITASDGTVNDYFSGMHISGVHGSPLSISSVGSTIAVGVPRDNSDQGSVYIYKRNEGSWVETLLTAEDGISGDGFGFSVSVSSNGNTVAVGAWKDDGGAGSVYVYKLINSSWEETKITASVRTNSSFGLSVSISADEHTIIVGAYHDAPGGSAYIYKWDGISWIETKLTTPVGSTSFGFHVAVSSDGNIVAVGTPTGTGTAYVYRWNNSTWNETKITASDGEAGDYFGRIVSLSADGNTLLTGAYRDTIDGIVGQGSAYIFKYSGSVWNETKITASDGESTDYFGYSASLSSNGNTMIIGAVSDTVEGHTDQGAAYIFSWDGSTWNEIKLIASDGGATDLFGYSAFISADGHTFAVGSPGAAVDSNNDQGAIYVY